MAIASRPALARLVEKQMRTWELARSQHLDAPSEPAAVVREFVSVSYQFGSGGDRVAARVAESLGWPFFDKAILQEMAGDDDTRRRLYESIDERDLSWLEEVGRALAQAEFRDHDYFHRLVTTVLAISRRGPAVFLGRATDLILPRDHGFRVKLFRSVEGCVDAHARDQGLDRDSAREELHELEAARMKLIARYFGGRATEPTRYDLAVNLDAFSEEQAVQLVLYARLAHTAR